MAASSQHLFPLKWSILIWAGILAFAAFMIVSIFPPAMERAAALVHCPSAVEIVGKQQDSGTITQGGRRISTTTTTITCIFTDGRTSTIGNDTMVVTGFGVALVGGGIVGALIALIRRLTSRRAAQTSI